MSHARALAGDLPADETVTPWRDQFLLVRPDQHIAWRTSDPDSIDLGVVTGYEAR